MTTEEKIIEEFLKENIPDYKSGNSLMNDIANWWVKKLQQHRKDVIEEKEKAVKKIKTRFPDGGFRHIEVYKDEILQTLTK